jgi:hypothetical protein
VRLLAVAAALVGALLLLALGRGMSLPWEPGCTVAGASGQVLAQGSPAEISVLVAAPEGDLARALGDPTFGTRVSAGGRAGVA